jgi:hypothetical protein
MYLSVNTLNSPTETSAHAVMRASAHADERYLSGQKARA